MNGEWKEMRNEGEFVKDSVRVRFVHPSNHQHLYDPKLMDAEEDVISRMAHNQGITWCEAHRLYVNYLRVGQKRLQDYGFRI